MRRAARVDWQARRDGGRHLRLEDVGPEARKQTYQAADGLQDSRLEVNHGHVKRFQIGDRRRRRLRSCALAAILTGHDDRSAHLAAVHSAGAASCLGDEVLPQSPIWHQQERPLGGVVCRRGLSPKIRRERGPQWHLARVRRQTSEIAEAEMTTKHQAVLACTSPRS